MTIETQMLRALEGGMVLTRNRLRRAAYCSDARARKAVRVLVDLQLIRMGLMATNKRQQVFYRVDAA